MSPKDKLIAVAFHKAYREAKCSYCKLPIDKGTRYFRKTYESGVTIIEDKLHAVCERNQREKENDHFSKYLR